MNFHDTSDLPTHPAGHGLEAKLYQYVLDVTFVEQAEGRRFRGLFPNRDRAESEAYACWPNEVLSVKVTSATQYPLAELTAIEVL